MSYNFDKNQIDDDEQNFEEIEFKYNFINTPWDDRSRRSKIVFVSFQVAIFVTILALVANNFVMHYKNFGLIRNTSSLQTISCDRVKTSKYPFVARIYSVPTEHLLCVGAVVSETSVLASGVCAQSGAIRLRLGGLGDSRCKRVFAIKAIESVYHDGIASKRLVILSTYESMAECSKPISIGRALNWNVRVIIIGRPYRTSRLLSRQLVTIVDKKYKSSKVSGSTKTLNLDSMICVKYLTSCPVQAGDLLVQRGRLFGISATSVQLLDSNQIACFADLNIVMSELKDLDDKIDTGPVVNQTRRTIKL